MSEQKIDLAVVGATDALGEAVLELLADRQYPVGRLVLLGEGDALGKRVQFGGRSLSVESLEDFDFSKVQLSLFLADAEVAAKYAPKAAEAGSLVIDSSHYFRYEVDVPLVVAEVNPERVSDVHQRGIIASPDPATVQLMLALSPLHDEAGIERVNVAGYYAVSTAGSKGVETLAGETARLLNGKSVTPGLYPKQMAFNVLPQSGELLENGYTRDEMMLVLESRKILQDEMLGINVTIATVPVFYGHSLSVQVQTRETIDVELALDLWQEVPGVEVMTPGNSDVSPTPVTESAQQEATFIGRIRQDLTIPRALNLWIVADNVRKGAAFNIIRIAELLEKTYL